MEPTQNQDIYAVPPEPSSGEVNTPPATVVATRLNSKKPMPKIILWGSVFFLALLLVLFVVKQFTSRKMVSSELVWWGLWEDENIISSLISEYEAKNPKVKIKYIKQSPRDYRERLMSAFAKGTGPDIFRFHNTWVPMLSRELDTLPVHFFNPADFAKTFYPVAISDLTLTQGIVGIPLEYDGLALFINEDIFTSAGKTPPTSWDELRQLAKELTVKNEEGVITQAGVALGRVENVDHWPEILALMMLQNGVDLTKPTGKKAEDALKFFTLFSTVDGVWDATLPSSTIAFAGGRLAMYFGPTWRAHEISEMNPTLKFKTVPLPQLPKDTPEEPDFSYATYWVEGVWSRSKNKETAWNFLKFLSERESLQKFYDNASKVRGFGEPYPRVDMASLLTTHPILGSVIAQAPGARSWYLASRTFDGPTGINSLLSKYFEDAINAVISGKETEKALETLAQGVAQVLSQYRLGR